MFARRSSMIALTVACCTFSACRRDTLAVPFYRTADLTPEWLTAASASTTDIHRVGPFKLMDQSGAIISDAVLAKHATVIHFFFTTCAGICPTTQSNIARLLASMPNESRVQVLSHSVMPERDSLAMLQMYATLHHIDDTRWHLLTGARTTIGTLARDSYFVNLSNGRSYGVSDLAHTETVVLVDSAGRLRGVYTGSLPLDIERLGEDIRAILAEGD